MMTEVELILGALAGGVAAGVTNSASSLVTETLADLRAKLRTALKGRVEPAVLEAQEVSPEYWQSELAGPLRDTKASTDHEIIKTAQQLWELLQQSPQGHTTYNVNAANSRGLQTGNQNTQTNYF